jgi:Spy/CpxP family protein refolding chaperone
MTMLRSATGFRLVCALSLSMALAACAGAKTESSVPQIAGATVAPLASPNAHGPIRRLAEVFGKIPLRAEQRTEVEALLAAASLRHDAVMKGGLPLMNALAEQIEKGVIDRASLLAIASEAHAKHEAAMVEDRAAIAKLHALLLPEQRAMVADSLKEREGGSRHGGHSGHRHEHEGTEGKDEGPEAAHDGQRMHEHGGGLFVPFRALNLDDAQKAKIAEILKDQRSVSQGAEHEHGHEAHHKNVREGLEAFRSPNFDAQKALPAVDSQMGIRMIDMAEKIVKVLTPEQRTLAAKMMRERALSKSEHAR